MRPDVAVPGATALATGSDHDRPPFWSGASLSGNERNRMFLNLGERRFADTSGVSGLDDPADGRKFALWDFDRDGWLDVAAVNANPPLLKLYRNRMAAAGAASGAIVLRLVGGNDTPAPAAGRSPRDPFGAGVTLAVAGGKIVRELKSSDGFAAQDSASLIVGIGGHPLADRIEVRWPSGEVTRTGAVPAGSLVTVHEVPARAPGGAAYRVERYARNAAESRPARAVRVADGERLPVPSDSVPGSVPDWGPLTVTTTMATWCQVCLEHLPRVARLRDQLPEVGWLGLPGDPEESPDEIEQWERRHRPAYRLLAAPPPELAERAAAVIGRELGPGALPASIVTAGDGRIVAVRPGLPSLSELRRLAEELR